MPFINGEGLEVVKEIFNSKYAGKNAEGAVVSVGADYAEYGDWADGNPSGANRTGYFVTIAPGTNDIQIANSESAITGVTTDSAGFIGNYSKGAESDSSKGLVGIVGQVSVIDNGTCSIGGRCMPADDGTAEPSSNNCGYLVVDRIDIDHVRILVSPTIDMVQRIRTDVSALENDKAEASHQHDASDIASGTLDVATVPSVGVSNDYLVFFGYSVTNGKSRRLFIPVFAPGKRIANISGTAAITIRAENNVVNETVKASGFNEIVLRNGGALLYLSYDLTTAIAIGNNQSFTGYMTGLNISFE